MGRERGGKNIPQKKCWLEQGRHGKILIFHAGERKNADGEKTKLTAKYRGYVKQVEL